MEMGYVPKYYILRQHLLQRIEKGEFEEGQMIPSEHELMERYQFSRITVRKALDELVNEGYLYRIQGKGTFVRTENAVTQNLYALNSCTEDVRKLGKTPSKKTVFSEKTEADDKKVRTLQLAPGDMIFTFGRITYADGEPLNYTVTSLPEKSFPRLDSYDLEANSLYDILRNEYHAEIIKARRTVEAVLPEPVVARYLQISPDLPVILFRCVTYGKMFGKELPIETFRCYYRTDHYKFSIDQVTR